MQHCRILSVLALVSGALFGISVGCGSSDTGSAAATTTTATTSGAGGEGGAGGAGGAGGGQGGQGLAPGSCYNGDDTVLTVETFYLGDITFDDTPDPNAWAQLGRDVDGITSSGDFTNHCLPAPGGSTAAFVDGENGIDNSFGRNMLPNLINISPVFTQQVNEAIFNGDYTLMFKFDDLGPGDDQDPVLTKLYNVAGVKQANCWPVLRDQLDDPTDIESTPFVFPDSALSGNTWTSGAEITLPLTLNFIGYPMTLTIKHARLSMQLDSNHKGASFGQIGGVLDTEEFIAAYRQVIGTVDDEYCLDTNFNAIANQIRLISDIMTDGTQDPQATCNGISIGIGFYLAQARLGGLESGDPVDPPCQ